MIYLIHLQEKLHHAQHYLGFTEGLNVATRMKQHRAGVGARMLANCNKGGIEYDVVATLSAGRDE